MTPFQQDKKETLIKIAHKSGAEIICNTYDCKQNDLLGHEVGDKYIEASININNITIVAYIYTDEGSVIIGNRTIMFELPDYKNDANRLGQALIEFVQKAIDGAVAT